MEAVVDLTFPLAPGPYRLVAMVTETGGQQHVLGPFTLNNEQWTTMRIVFEPQLQASEPPPPNKERIDSNRNGSKL